MTIINKLKKKKAQVGNPSFTVNPNNSEYMQQPQQPQIPQQENVKQPLPQPFVDNEVEETQQEEEVEEEIKEVENKTIVKPIFFDQRDKLLYETYSLVLEIYAMLNDLK